MQGELIIVRHGESEWNALGKWTGITDIRLTKKGREEGRKYGETLRGIHVDLAYVSQQHRTEETLQEMMQGMGAEFPYETAGAINERDYGVYTGKNKWEVKDAVGEDEFNQIRRGWDKDIPGGESLKQVYERTVPFYLDTILPQLKDGKTILVVAHGNSIRSLMKYIESISDKGVEDLEMVFGTVLRYRVDDSGKLVDKEVKMIDTALPPA